MRSHFQVLHGTPGSSESTDLLPEPQRTRECIWVHGNTMVTLASEIATEAYKQFDGEDGCLKPGKAG